MIASSDSAKDEARARELYRADRPARVITMASAVLEGAILLQIYDPATGNWTAAPDMVYHRALQQAISLPSGKVLMAGGLGGKTWLSSSDSHSIGGVSRFCCPQYRFMFVTPRMLAPLRTNYLPF